MYLMGRRGHKTEGYPSGQGAAVAAFSNRNIGDVPIQLTAPFTPATGTGSLIAAILFTPKVSGVIQVATNLEMVNGTSDETYGALALISSGTNLSVTGGELTNHGWIVGSNTPPVIGGSGITIVGRPGVDTTAPLTSGAVGALATFGISQPLPLNVPVLVELNLAEAGGGHSLAGLLIAGLSVLELP